MARFRRVVDDFIFCAILMILGERFALNLVSPNRANGVSYVLACNPIEKGGRLLGLLV